MFQPTKVFSGFSAPDIEAERRFYADTLGIEVGEENGILQLRPPGGGETVVYPKADHQPATFTVLNFAVDDIDAAVAELGGKGIQFERYDGMPQDDDGVMRGHGPSIAWFKDPAGNILSVIQT
jgi:catechol 2,3-dioxygenase-like lactoylglutathione lyase family enzyme